MSSGGRRILPLLWALAAGQACQSTEFLEPPLLGEAHLVIESAEALPRLSRVVLGPALRLELAEGERLFVVAPEGEEVSRLHPELLLDRAQEVELYWSELPADACPYGEAPRAGVRGHALPPEAWRIHELSETGFRAPRVLPEWLARLRLRAPVAPACGLPEPVFRIQPFPGPTGVGSGQLARVDARRWVLRNVYGTAIELVELDPPRVVATLTAAALGMPDELEPLKDLLVDTSTSPPALVIASLDGVVRARLHEDAIEVVSHEGRGLRFWDLEPYPSGGVVGVGEDGDVFHLPHAFAPLQALRILPGIMLDHVRYAGARDFSFVLAAQRGPLYFGDPVASPSGLTRSQVSIRSWRTLSVARGPSEVEVFGLETGTGLARIGGPGVLDPIPQLIPPEASGCDLPAPDACGYRDVSRVRAETMLATHDAGLDANFLLLGLERCAAVTVIRPASGCFGAFEVESPAELGEFLRLSEEPEGVYVSGRNGHVLRWDRGRSGVR